MSSQLVGQKSWASVLELERLSNLFITGIIPKLNKGNLTIHLQTYLEL
jgi:hypothetical protein